MARKAKAVSGESPEPAAAAPQEATAPSGDEWVEFHVLRTDEVGEFLEIFESGGGRLIRVAKKDREIIGTDRVRLRRGTFKIEL